MKSWTVRPIDPIPEKQDYLICRYWDGIDKPDYLPFCKITKEERNLRSGRFKNFIGWKEPYECTFYDIDFDTINLKYKNGDILIDWINENINGRWGLSVDFWLKTFAIYFENDEDATAFKLRWL